MSEAKQNSNFQKSFRRDTMYTAGEMANVPCGAKKVWEQEGKHTKTSPSQTKAASKSGHVSLKAAAV